MIQLKRNAAMATAYGVEAHVISLDDAAARYPLMRIDDLVGAVWIPGDGKANPADITQALAKGARAGGAAIHEGVKVTGVRLERGAVAGVETSQGPIATEILVNCAGMWARELGRMSGVTVPLHACEHMYIVTNPIPGMSPDHPVMRDADGHIYFKEEVGGLLMGGFDPWAKPWGMDGIPEGFTFGTLAEDWDKFEILMQNAIERVPALETAQVRLLMNGPESFTPDNYFILGEAPEVRRYYVGAGFCSGGIAAAGGAGKALAEWIVEGRAPMDLWPADIRRFAPFHGNRRFLRERVSEIVGVHYNIAFPNRELTSGRGLRRSPLHERLRERRACFGAKMGWERANWFAPDGVEPEAVYSFGRQNWFPYAAAEHRAAREAVAVFDQTSFAKLKLEGADAEAVLQRLCANDVDVPPGRVVYTAMLNERGGFESDLTVTRLTADAYLIVTGSAQGTRDLDWIRRHLPAGARATVTELTGAYAVLGLMGPRSRELLARARAHQAEHRVGAGHLGHGGAGARGQVAPDPVEIARALRGAGHDEVGVGGEPRDRQVALEAAALVEHRGVDHAAGRNVHVVGAEPLQHRLRVRALELELGERGLVEDGHRLARGPVLGRGLREPVLAAEGVDGLRLDPVRGEPVGALPAHLGPEAGAAQPAPARELAVRERDIVVHAHDLADPLAQEATVAMKRREAPDIRRPEIHGRAVLDDPLRQRLPRPARGRDAARAEAGADIIAAHLGGLAQDEVVV